MDKNVSTCYATATKWTMYVYENVKAMKFIALENVNFKTRMTDLIDWWFLYVNSKCHEENKPEFLSSKAESIVYYCLLPLFYYSLLIWYTLILHPNA